jgi:hypothetical protein
MGGSKPWISEKRKRFILCEWAGQANQVETAHEISGSARAISATGKPAREGWSEGIAQLICPSGKSRRHHGGRRIMRLAALICFDIGALIAHKPRMPKKPGTNPKGEFAFFDVVYEDGSQRSNRRVPSELLGGLEGDEPARGFIIEQDREIAEKAGRPVLAIKSIERVGAKKKKA